MVVLLVARIIHEARSETAEVPSAVVFRAAEAQPSYFPSYFP
jgi:hypothetical protein